MMPSEARDVWDAAAALLPPRGVEALAVALAANDPRVRARRTTRPVNIPADWPQPAPVAACCPLGFALWQGLGLTTCQEVESRWAELCSALDRHFREVGSVRFFTNWLDDNCRYFVDGDIPDLVRRDLLEAVLDTLGHAAAVA